MTTVIPEDNATQLRTITTQPRTVESGFSEALIAHRLLREPKQPEKIVYEFTQDAGLLHQYFRLREDMFISVWGLEHFSGQKDVYDDHSQIMVARRGLQCIAGGRLTVATPENRQSLPMEKEDLHVTNLFPELNLSEHTYGEFSRLAILPEFRSGVVFPEIARRFIKKAISEGVTYAFNIAPQPLARSYRQTVQLLGLKWDLRYDIEIPDREEYEGIRMVLSVMDLSKHVEAKRGAKTSQTEALDALIAE